MYLSLCRTINGSLYTMVEYRLAYYDYVYIVVACVLALGYFLTPLFPKRKGLGKREYDHHKYYDECEEWETDVDHKYREAYKGRANKRYFYIEDDKSLWCFQRIRICNPVDHIAWFRWVYTLALGLCFQIHIMYYFELGGPGDIGHQTDNQVWFSLGVGLCIAGIFVRWHWLQDVGFVLGAWLTVIIWVMKTWAPNLQLGYTVTVVTLTAVVALAALGFCIFWAACATAGCLICCCKDTIGHFLAIFLVRLHMTVVLCTGIMWASFTPVYGVSHFQTSDQEWLYRGMYTVALLGVFHYVWRFCFCSSHDNVLGRCLSTMGCGCCTECYEGWRDPTKHTILHRNSSDHPTEPDSPSHAFNPKPPKISAATRGPGTDTVLDLDDDHDYAQEHDDDEDDGRDLMHRLDTQIEYDEEEEYTGDQ